MNNTRIFKHKDNFRDNTEHLRVESDGRTYLVRKDGTEYLSQIWDLDECLSMVKAGNWIETTPSPVITLETKSMLRDIKVGEIFTLNSSTCKIKNAYVYNIALGKNQKGIKAFVFDSNGVLKTDFLSYEIFGKIAFYIVPPEKIKIKVNW